MLPRFALTSFVFIPLIGLVIVIASAMMPAALSGGSLAFPSTSGGHSPASSSEAGTDRSVWLSAASHIDQNPCPYRYYQKHEYRQHLELTFTETDEISIYWRLRGKSRNMFWGRPPSVEATPVPKPIYCPEWYNPRQLMLFEEEPRSRLFYDLAVTQVRHSGEIIGSYDLHNQKHWHLERGRVINWIWSNYSGLKREWLLQVLTDSQKTKPRMGPSAAAIRYGRRLSPGNGFQSPPTSLISQISLNNPVMPSRRYFLFIRLPKARPGLETSDCSTPSPPSSWDDPPNLWNIPNL